AGAAANRPFDPVENVHRRRRRGIGFSVSLHWLLGRILEYGLVLLGRVLTSRGVDWFGLGILPGASRAGPAAATDRCALVEQILPRITQMTRIFIRAIGVIGGSLLAANPIVPRLHRPSASSSTWRCLQL